jgi:Effector Associated Constant Component 1
LHRAADGESVLTMSTERLSLRVEVDGEPEADAQERDELTRALRDELLELDVDAVDRPETPAPEGARGAGIELGTLLVTFGQGALGLVTSTIARWAARRSGRSVTLELDGDRIELSGVSEDDQRRLIETFVARHAKV